MNRTLSHYTDDELLEQLLVLLTLCKLDDQQALAQLYQLIAAKLNGIAYRITRNKVSANRVLVRVFIQLWQQRKQFDFNKTDPFVWLVTQVRQTAQQQLRQDLANKKITRLVLNQVEVDNYYNAFGEFDPINKERTKFTKAIASLAQKQSQALLMAYLYGYNYQEIAQYFNISIHRTKSWLRRASSKISICLKS
jgi:RNA polymerase sigma-70 factor (ECF subfamily)